MDIELINRKLDQISETGEHLAVVAANPRAWEMYQVTGESRDVVIDRLQNGIDTLVLEIAALLRQVQP